MAVRFKCVCGKEVVAPDGSEGKKAKCPACKRILLIAAKAPEADGISEDGASVGQATRKRILVVEDDADTAAIIRELLEVEGYEVLVAYDGETGLHMVREKNPDLVILDLMLPKMNGYEICRQMKDPANVANKHCWSTPVIMLTARSKERDRRYGLAVGADTYINKPFKTTELSGWVGRLLEEKAG